MICVFFFRFGIGSQPFQKFCEMDNCQTTTDRSEFHQSDAVLFFGRLLDYSKDDVIPVRANQDQVFVYANSESPVIQWGNTWRFGRQVNVTMTYRLDSTIPWLEYIVARREPTAEPYVPPTTEVIRSRNGTVAWMISHCSKGGSIRMSYERELRQYVDVDVYGRCGSRVCSKDSTHECMQNMEKNYLFYLAFENSVCTDYVTEKLFRTLRYDLVPVVMGGANYAKLLPPNSYIDVRNFTSAANLAEYLKHLQKNPEEYLTFLQWKNDFIIEDEYSPKRMCQLCDLLHSNTPLLRDFDVATWWEGSHCVREFDDLMTMFPI